MISGCGIPIEGISPEGRTIARINVDLKGAALSGQQNMTTVCKGFLLSHAQVRDFFIYAAYIKDADPENRYDILPCYSSGTALIDNIEYKWIIRAGGVGEFTSKDHKFIKICGKNCCHKVSYIC